MRRLVVVGLFVAAMAANAEALTIRDVIELAQAGLGDDVLLALIEVDRGVYAIDTATLKRLKAAGVSDRVIAAMVRSGREVPLPAAIQMDEPDPVQDPPAPQVVVIDHHEPAVERIREVPVAVPVYIPVNSSRFRHRSTIHAGFDASNFVPFQSGPPAARPSQPRKDSTVYWGHGGKLRPDAWDPNVKQPDRRK